MMAYRTADAMASVMFYFMNAVILEHMTVTIAAAVAAVIFL